MALAPYSRRWNAQYTGNTNTQEEISGKLGNRCELNHED